MSKGFIPIRRTLFDHFLFKEKRVFSRFEAWLDLIQMASFKDDNSDIIGGKLITKDRGEIVASLRYLMNRWGWSMHKVCDYLELLRSRDMAFVDKESGINKIVLVNFEKHNSLNLTEGNEKNSKRNRKRSSKTPIGIEFPNNKGAPEGTEKGANGEQSGNFEGTNIITVNNGKKEESAPDQKFINNQKAFGKQLVPYLPKYGKEMIREFYDHWSEPNKSKTKMRWEMQDTWDLQKRLAKWERNQEKFGGKAKTEPEQGKNLKDQLLEHPWT